MDWLYNEFIFHKYVGNPLEITVNFVVSLALCRNQAVGTNPTDVSFTRRVKHQSQGRWPWTIQDIESWLKDTQKFGSQNGFGEFFTSYLFRWPVWWTAVLKVQLERNRLFLNNFTKLQCFSKFVADLVSLLIGGCAPLDGSGNVRNIMGSGLHTDDGLGAPDPSQHVDNDRDCSSNWNQFKSYEMNVIVIIVIVAIVVITFFFIIIIFFFFTVISMFFFRVIILISGRILVCSEVSLCMFLFHYYAPWFFPIEEKLNRCWIYRLSHNESLEFYPSWRDQTGPNNAHLWSCWVTNMCIYLLHCVGWKYHDICIWDYSQSFPNTRL